MKPVVQLFLSPVVDTAVNAMISEFLFACNQLFMSFIRIASMYWPDEFWYVVICALVVGTSAFVSFSSSQPVNTNNKASM